jgi:hypothetical protein
LVVQPLEATPLFAHIQQYPADISLTGIGKGVTDVIKRLKEQDKACPEQKFAIVGYSQGAGVMHAAASSIPAPIQEKILAVVMFGSLSLILLDDYILMLHRRSSCGYGTKVPSYFTAKTTSKLRSSRPRTY